MYINIYSYTTYEHIYTIYIHIYIYTHTIKFPLCNRTIYWQRICLKLGASCTEMFVYLVIYVEASF